MTYAYRTGPRTKRDQVLYWAQAEPGSSGSPVFLAATHALVGLHHTGNLRPETFDLTQEQTGEFTNLLGATDAAAIADALRAAGVVHERQVTRFEEER